MGCSKSKIEIILDLLVFLGKLKRKLKHLNKVNNTVTHSTSTMKPYCLKHFKYMHMRAAFARQFYN